MDQHSMTSLELTELVAESACLLVLSPVLQDLHLSEVLMVVHSSLIQASKVLLSLLQLLQL